MKTIVKHGDQITTGIPSHHLAKIASVLLILFACSGIAVAEDISGTITATKIKLRLNGFTITGPANPDDSTTCNPTSGAPAADLISSGGQTGIQIIGPGMVQKSKRHGIL